jgi:RimJ/RimL family protein N-acetyltransferase
MDEIILENLTEEDINIIREWLQKDYIKKWYDPKSEWISEIKNENGEYNFIKHFIVKCNSQKIGFCQYYDCFEAQEEWYRIDKSNNIYSIDYFIGEEKYLNKGYGKEIILKLIEKIKMENGKEIIVQPDIENIQSNKILLANGFEYIEDKKYLYKKI